MSDAYDLLVEIGTEELPPKALRSLMDAFAENLGAGIDEARLERGELAAFASPRRLAALTKASGCPAKSSNPANPPPI